MSAAMERGPVFPHDESDEDFFGDLTPIIEDDLAAFVPASEVGVSKTVIREIGDRDTIAETQQWLRKLNADAGDVPPDFAMTRVLERWADGSREGQKMGVLALVRLDERGHHGLAAALDQLWQVRAKDPRDFRRLTEWARSRVLTNPTPAADKGCTCDLSLSVRSHVKREPQDEEEGEPEQEPTPEEVAAYRRSKLIAEELEKLQIREEARRRMRLEGREPLRALRGQAFLDDGAELTYLIPRLLYHSSTAKIYGPPGAGKTNLALDIALSVATATKWRGVVELEPRVVHFLMAEGEAVNRMRVAAFVHRHEVKPEALDNFVAIPQGVLLTPEGVAEYLDLVKLDRPALIILDTKNAMMDGDENAASDVAVMVRAMRMIRDAGDRACVVLIDHTGLSDESRGRGSNAVTAAMDTEIRVTKARRAGAVVYTAEVTRDKASSEFEMAAFSFTLHPVDIDRPEGVPAPPVAEWDDKILTREPEIPVIDRRWFEIPVEELPVQVQELEGTGSDVARDAFRFLLRTDDVDGLTATTVKNAIAKDAKERGRKPHSDSSFWRGWAMLKELSGLMEQGSSPTKWRTSITVSELSIPRSEALSEVDR